MTPVRPVVLVEAGVGAGSDPVEAVDGGPPEVPAPVVEAVDLIEYGLSRL